MWKQPRRKKKNRNPRRTANGTPNAALAAVGSRFVSFVKNFSEHFRSYRHDVTDKARQYASGLMQAGSRKNMDRIAEVIPNSKARNLQQFITHIKLDAQAVIDPAVCDGNELIGDERQSGLLIDESAFPKQGKMPVGTARQWLGRLGKVDNGQVAVFGVLARDRFALAIDVRLYLPQKWIDDPGRCDKADIPEAERVFRTKDDPALEIVSHARRNGTRYRWVGADAGYGKGSGFCRTLDRMGERFVVDLHADFRIFLEAPQPYMPARTSRRARQFSRHRVDEESAAVKDVIDRMDISSRPILKVRDTNRGALHVRAFRVPVYIWDEKECIVHQYCLIATQTTGKNPETKISLSNVPEE